MLGCYTEIEPKEIGYDREVESKDEKLDKRRWDTTTIMPDGTELATDVTCVDPLVFAAIPLTGTVGGGATGGRWERVSGFGTIGSSGTATGNNILGATINDTFAPTAADLSAGSVQVRLVATGAAAPCPGSCPR